MCFHLKHVDILKESLPDSNEYKYSIRCQILWRRVTTYYTTYAACRIGYRVLHISGGNPTYEARIVSAGCTVRGLLRNVAGWTRRHVKCVSTVRHGSHWQQVCYTPVTYILMRSLLQSTHLLDFGAGGLKILYTFFWFPLNGTLLQVII